MDVLNDINSGKSQQIHSWAMEVHILWTKRARVNSLITVKFLSLEGGSGHLLAIANALKYPALSHLLTNIGNVIYSKIYRPVDCKCKVDCTLARNLSCRTHSQLLPLCREEELWHIGIYSWLGRGYMVGGAAPGPSQVPDTAGVLP